MKKPNYFQSVSYRLAESLRGLAVKTKKMYTKLADKILNEPNFLLTAEAKYSKSWNRVIFSVVRYLAKTENNVKRAAVNLFTIDFNGEILSIFYCATITVAIRNRAKFHIDFAKKFDKLFNNIISKI